jgi:hypothetical protein
LTMAAPNAAPSPSRQPQGHQQEHTRGSRCCRLGRGSYYSCGVYV